MSRTFVSSTLQSLSQLDDGPSPGSSDAGTPVPLSKKRSYENAKPASGALKVVRRLNYKPGKWDIWMLGITIVIGGQYFSWNVGLTAGLYSYLICFFLIASAYVTLCCCTAEITGALPFAGGTYGLARCTLGFLPAFLIGCCEALEYIVYVSTSVIAFADMIVKAIPSWQSYQPLVWIIFYLSALFIQTNGDRFFWIFNRIIGVVSIVIVVIYCFGSMAYVDFGANAVHPDMKLVGGFSGFMRVLPLGCWFFVGVEALSLASDQVEQPKRIVPLGQILCVVRLAISGIFVLFVTVSLSPGINVLSTEIAPFDNGFEPLFNISHTKATILSLPATYATAFGFIWCYGKLIAAMATSHLLPVALSRFSSTSGAPYMALIFGSALSYIICLVKYFVPAISKHLFSICITAAFMSYTGQCIGYISLMKNYRNIKCSHFHSPFGIGGALYSMSIWILCIISIIGFQGNGGEEIMVFGIVVALLTTYYYVWARKRQTFSPQENRIMLVAHVMKFNIGRTAARK
ncbi:hypothetical protein Poli38472_004929 [Pythium oligandrum]|uniref:Amino acid permease/ SLC12A domain-containing protein n=1 Tax=Pythium oligandrum TaxID=41045 RepID=A0A8K1CB41_PYTOL|nr:hypothetical protein Poli38472_004929 [Pythium oligandrum]|eukprot:TMW59860.1 hypothetical protein Poli38472_004929 [Pythium oligandrum]